MSNMFQDCGKLTELNLSSFDKSKVQNMSRMFEGCKGLKTLDVSSFRTPEVKDMTKMFEYCSVTSLDVINFDTSNVLYMMDMFSEMTT